MDGVDNCVENSRDENVEKFHVRENFGSQEEKSSSFSMALYETALYSRVLNCNTFNEEEIIS